MLRHGPCGRGGGQAYGLGVVRAKSLQSCGTLCNPMDVARQVALSLGFSTQEYWSGLPCPPPGDLPYPGISRLLHWQVGSLLLVPLGNPLRGWSRGGMLSGSDCSVIRCPSWVGECPCSGKLDSSTQVEFLFHSHRTWIRPLITAHVPATNNICLSRGLLVFCALFSTVVHLAPSTGAQQTFWE